MKLDVVLGTESAGGLFTGMTVTGIVTVVILAGGGVLPRSFATIVMLALPLKK